ncbi:MAG TPA: flavodoxin [Clostridium sp.]
MNSRGIKLHERDIILLQKEKKLILKRVAEIEREILILSKYNREMKSNA